MTEAALQQMSTMTQLDLSVWQKSWRFPFNDPALLTLSSGTIEPLRMLFVDSPKLQWIDVFYEFVM